MKRDQEMLLAITEHSPEQMQRSIRRMLMRGVEGLVILESEIETQSYETMLHNRLPLVTLNRLVLEPGVSDVAIDATLGMRAAVAHLKALGTATSAFWAAKLAKASSARERQAFARRWPRIA